MIPIKIKERVIALWNSNMGSAEIAELLSMTRGAVMGVIHRAKSAGLIHRPPRVKGRQIKPSAAAPQRTKTVTLAVVSIQRKPDMPNKALDPSQPELPLVQPKTIMQLKPFDCRWIRTDGKYCAHPAKSAKTPWCDDHYKLVYVRGTSYALKKKSVRSS